MPILQLRQYSINTTASIPLSNMQSKIPSGVFWSTLPPKRSSLSVIGLAEEHGLTLTWWHVMDAGRDSVDLLRQWLDQFGGRLKLVVVLNEIRGDRFEILDASGERARAEALGASVITLRRLPDTTMQKVDRQSASFWAAINHHDRAAVGLGLLERQRVKVWLHRTYGELAKVAL